MPSFLLLLLVLLVVVVGVAVCFAFVSHYFVSTLLFSGDLSFGQVKSVRFHHAHP